MAGAKRKTEKIIIKFSSTLMKQEYQCNFSSKILIVMGMLIPNVQGNMPTFVEQIIHEHQ